MLKPICIVVVAICLAAFVFCLAAIAQEYARHSLFYYDVSGNVEYICSAASEGHGTTTWTIAGASLTSIVVSSNVGTVTTAAAHGLTVGSRVVVAGATEDTDLNGTYSVVTAPTGTTFTITTASVGDDKYVDATLAVSYAGARTTAAIWSIQRFYYDASNYPFKGVYAVGTAGPGRVATDRVCASRATYEYR